MTGRGPPECQRPGCTERAVGAISWTYCSRTCAAPDLDADHFQFHAGDG